MPRAARLDAQLVGPAGLGQSRSQRDARAAIETAALEADAGDGLASPGVLAARPHRTMPVASARVSQSVQVSARPAHWVGRCRRDSQTRRSPSIP